MDSGRDVGRSRSGKYLRAGVEQFRLSLEMSYLHVLITCGRSSLTSGVKITESSGCSRVPARGFQGFWCICRLTVMTLVVLY